MRLRRAQFVVSALLAGVIVSGCGEDRRERFTLGAEALRSEVAKRGWVPAWLPASATNIDIRYNLDTNYIWLAFRLDELSAIALQRQLRPIDDHHVRELELRTPRGGDGWPEGVIQQQPANDGALNAKMFCGAGTIVPTSTCIAFERTTDHVYAWIPRSSQNSWGQAFVLLRPRK